MGSNQRLPVAQVRGHQVVIASNGCEALETLQHGAFDVVLMDVQMPEMDGYETTAMIRERERETGGHVPIIAMTAHAMKGDRERCLDAGMDGSLTKPIHAQALYDRVDAISRRVGGPVVQAPSRWTLRRARLGCRRESRRRANGSPGADGDVVLHGMRQEPSERAPSTPWMRCRCGVSRYAEGSLNCLRARRRGQHSTELIETRRSGPDEAFKVSFSHQRHPFLAFISN